MQNETNRKSHFLDSFNITDIFNTVNDTFKKHL